jgi:hypothetical protein
MSSMGRHVARPAGVTLMLLAALLAGCGDDGPGTLTVTVEAPEALGAVSIEVVGPGVLGFEGMGSTEAYGGTVSAREGRHRVVVVDPTGGPELTFGIRVEDVSAPWPTLRLVSAAGTDDVERITSDIEVSLARQ